MFLQKRFFLLFVVFLSLAVAAGCAETQKKTVTAPSPSPNVYLASTKPQTFQQTGFGFETLVGTWKGPWHECQGDVATELLIGSVSAPKEVPLVYKRGASQNARRAFAPSENKYSGELSSNNSGSPCVSFTTKGGHRLKFCLQKDGRLIGENMSAGGSSGDMAELLKIDKSM